jgi:hypothetical protein
MARKAGIALANNERRHETIGALASNNQFAVV